MYKEEGWKDIFVLKHYTFPPNMILSSSFWLPLQSQVQDTHFLSKTMKEEKSYWLTSGSPQFKCFAFTIKKIQPVPQDKESVTPFHINFAFSLTFLQ